jgi:hypothetical protein
MVHVRFVCAPSALRSNRLHATSAVVDPVAFDDAGALLVVGELALEPLLPQALSTSAETTPSTGSQRRIVR